MWTKKQLEGFYNQQRGIIDTYEKIIVQSDRNLSFLEDRVFRLEMLLVEAGIELPKLGRRDEPEVAIAKREQA